MQRRNFLIEKQHGFKGKGFSITNPLDIDDLLNSSLGRRDGRADRVFLVYQKAFGITLTPDTHRMMVTYLITGTRKGKAPSVD